MTETYDDIIGLPHHTSKTHPRMAPIDRAAQFSPFAALSGHEAAIRETARLTDSRAELDEDERAELDLRLRLVASQKQTEVQITYFQPDEKKTGGYYQTETGFIKRIDDVQRAVLMTNGNQISIDDIFGIESELFNSLL